MKPIQINAALVPGYVSAITNKRTGTVTVSYKKPGAQMASKLAKGISQEDLVMMLEADECSGGDDDGDDDPGVDWRVAYTVVKGCQTVAKIAKTVGVSPEELVWFNQGHGMTVKSTLRVGTGLWVSASALSAMNSAGASPGAK